MRCKKCSKTFRSPSIGVKKTQICNECRSISENNVNAKDIGISKGQARFLKTIARSIGDKELSEFSLRKSLQDKTDVIYFIKDNWGDIEHFINLALDHKTSNPISLILYFLNLRKKINEVPTKEKMREISKINLSEYEYRFGTWEQFLDLLGFNPWYREDVKQKESVRPRTSETKRIEKIKPNPINYFIESDSFEETIEKIKSLKVKIKITCEKKDSEGSFVGYSHVEMFQLLENYLKLLPDDPKYADLKIFF